jgi:hypothetical protein
MAMLELLPCALLSNALLMRKATHWCRKRSITRRWKGALHGQILTLLLLLLLLLNLPPCQTGMLVGHL